MTNEQIIMKEKIDLLKEGKIKTTGRILTIPLADGSVVQIPETEQIHTFQGWKERGYLVRKGEKAITKFAVWHYSKSKKIKVTPDGEENNGKCYLRMSSFFSASQVEKQTA